MLGSLRVDGALMGVWLIRVVGRHKLDRTYEIVMTIGSYIIARFYLTLTHVFCYLHIDLFRDPITIHCFTVFILIKRRDSVLFLVHIMLIKLLILLLLIYYSCL